VADSATQFYPAARSRDTVEALFAAHGPTRAEVFWLILAGVVTTLVALPFIKVDVSVSAPGVVRPATERIAIRSPVSGRIAQILLRDNSPVAGGQPLLVVAAPDLEERLARNRAQQATRADLISDLRQLTTGLPADGGDKLPPVSRAAATPPPAFRTETAAREHAQFLTQLDAAGLDETKARADCERFATLAAKGISSQSELDHARYEVARLQAEAKLTVRQALARWQSRLRDEESAAADLASEERRLREEVTHFTIRAPAEGLLIGFTGWGVGGFITTGQDLGAVSPNGRLLVESLVSPADIGLIAPGQRTRIAVDAYPYTRWGTLEGSVVSVSGDSLGALPTASPHFKVIVQPSLAELRLPGGARAGLRKGFTVRTRFLVARLSLFQLLYDDANSRLDPQGPGQRAAPPPQPPHPPPA